MNRANRAIILVAGEGKRLRPLTFTCPKCLIQVGKVSILKQIIDSLVINGVEEITIVVGYLAKQVIETFGSKYLKTKIYYVENQNYLNTNSMYSLFLGLSNLKNDLERTWIIEGDIFSDAEIFSKKTFGDICWFVDSSKNNIDGAYLRISKNNVAESLQIIRDTTLIAKDEHKSMGILNVSTRGVNNLKKYLSLAVKEGKVDQYYDLILKDHFKEMSVNVVDCSGITWQEIDTVEDLEKARKMFK